MPKAVNKKSQSKKTQEEEVRDKEVNQVQVTKSKKNERVEAPTEPLSQTEIMGWKKKAFEMEKTNEDKIIAFAAKKGWYKIGGRSALIYYYRIAKRINLSPRLVADTDFFSKFKEGVISIRRIETLEKNLKKLKIFRNVHCTTPYKLYVFDLGYKLDEQDFYLMEHDEELRRKKFNEMVMPKVAFPEIHAEAWKMTKGLYAECRKLPVVEREFIGKEIFGQIVRLHKCFVLMSNGRRDTKKALLEILSAVEGLKSLLKMGLEYEIWNVKTVGRISENLVKIERLVEAEIRRLVRDGA